MNKIEIIDIEPENLENIAIDFNGCDEDGRGDMNESI